MKKFTKILLILLLLVSLFACKKETQVVIDETETKQEDIVTDNQPQEENEDVADLPEISSDIEETTSEESEKSEENADLSEDLPEIEDEPLQDEDISEQTSSTRESTYIIEMTLEGNTEEVETTLYESQNYSLYLQTDQWTAYEFGDSTKFLANFNEQVFFEINETQEQSLQDVENAFLAQFQDFDFKSSENGWSYVFLDQDILSYKIFEGENDIIYTFMTSYSLEAAEGFGVRIQYMLDTFLVK